MNPGAFMQKRTIPCLKSYRKRTALKIALELKSTKLTNFDLRSMLSVNGHSIIPANQIYEMSGWRIDEINNN